MKGKKEAERVKYYLAIDVGESGGSHTVGYEKDGALVTDKVYTFDSCIESDGENPIWNIERLVDEALAGLFAAFEKYPEIDSISVDGVGADYVVMSDTDAVLPVYTSRDVRGAEVIDEVRALAGAKTIYENTGVYLQASNSACHLFADNEWGRLEETTDFLMIPEYIAYKLTGAKKRELTIGASTGLVNSCTLRYDRKIWSSIGIPLALASAELCEPGDTVGKLKPELAKRVGREASVVLCSSDRIASAVEASELLSDEPYIFLGDPSVLGLKTQSAIKDDRSFDSEFSNKGTRDYNRYEKEIFDVRILARLKAELCPDESEEGIAAMAKKSVYFESFDVSDRAFLAPRSVKDAIDAYMTEKGKALPSCAADYFKCAYMSIGYRYGVSVADLEYNTGRYFRHLYMIGANEDSYLKKVIEKCTGKKITTLSDELCATGNLKSQMKKR